MDSKACSTCNIVLPRTSEHFFSDKTHADGLSSRCTTCHSKASKKWDAQHKAKMDKYQRAYRSTNRDRMLSQNADWRARYHAYSIERTRKWREDNPGLRSDWKARNPEKVQEQRIRAKKKRRAKEAAIDASRMLNLKAVYARFDGHCGICGHRVPFDKAVWDHIIPVDKYGPHTEENTEPAHALCNQIKGNRTLEWAQNRVRILEEKGLFSPERRTLKKEAE